ncbi:protein RICE SALT SENSITIVE 3-like [Dioscorea cayenensis subsp. rotundata]|uniref:Protein RICE SALT SENSITIVE 3-like n=1 Tax=Dioscorea cayennensis subsp. rotundata TaxID=55577 RepID=A0AB40BW83_DIOCR|nr:protein RICE SALT SENSITIVE 3-like [Dioscorea cayenensis subsp. rotundata]
MECGLPLLNCLWQQTLQSFCFPDASSSSKWVYAVFWRILPRNFPPPRWDCDGREALNQSNASKRNWILVWEDGFCDFYEASFAPEIFFKMSHEVYTLGEGVVGKVAAENSHKWMHSGNTHPETNGSHFSSWDSSTYPQPKVWQCQFNSGIQTIAVIAVKEGAIQLGSLDKVPQDLILVMNIQRKFNYLQSIPGMFAMQRPYQAFPENYIHGFKQSLQITEKEDEENNAAFGVHGSNYLFCDVKTEMFEVSENKLKIRQ